VGDEIARSVQNLGDVDATKRLGEALVLLFISALGWRDDTAPIAVRQLQERGGATRVALPWFWREMWHRKGDTVKEFTRWVIEWCVLAQSVRVAYEKTDPRGRNNRFFIERADGGYRLVQQHTLTARFAYDADRLGGAFGLLQSLSLIRRTGPGKPYNLTASGKAQFAVVRQRSTAGT
jgi:hypothetical protein